MRAIRRTDEGSVAVEAAVVLPALLLFTMVVVQAATLYYARAVAASAARQGLDAARVADGTETAGAAASMEFLHQAHAGITSPSVDANRGPEESTITVTGKVMSLVPGWTPVITITVSAPTERTIN